MALGTVNVPPKTKHTHTASDITDFAAKVAEQVAATEPKSHSHAYSSLTGIPSSFTPAAHTQAASTITAGTFAGAVVAQDDTNYTTYQVRNGALVSSKPSSIVNGRLAHVYS